MKTRKIQSVGNSVGVTLPAEYLAYLHVGVGDRVHITKTPDGGLKLWPWDPEFEQEVTGLLDMIRKDREAFEALRRRP